MAHRQLPEMPSGPVLELHGQRKVFHIPQGLKMLLEECTREVLRFQPANIYEFLANMLEQKLLIRNFKERTTNSDGSDRPRKSWMWRRWSWDGTSLLTEQDLIEFLMEFKISMDVAQRLALIIQSAYRGFLARKKVKELREERDTYRRSLWEEWNHPGHMFLLGRDVLEILAFYKISLFEANVFATKIQKVFRGHQYRKHLEEIEPELAAHLHTLGITKKIADVHASKIQSAFRGFMTRKALKQLENDTIVSIAEDVTQEDMEDEEDFEEDVEGLEDTIDDNNLIDPEDDEPKPKYEAFFPEGLDPADENEIQEGQKLPPKFTHEHFGEIDPQGLREKFSTPDFKEKMSLMMKGLERATEERRKANLEKLESTRKLKETRRLSAMKMVEEVRRLSEETPKETSARISLDASVVDLNVSAESRQDRGSTGTGGIEFRKNSTNSKPIRKTSTEPEKSRRTSAETEETKKSSTRTEESRKLSTGAEGIQKASTGTDETQKKSTEAEVVRKNSTGAEKTRKISTGAEEIRKKSTGDEEGRKTSTGTPKIQKVSSGAEEARKTSTGAEERRKVSTGSEEGRKTSAGSEEVRKLS